MGRYEKYLQDEVEFWQRYLQETYEPEGSPYHQQMMAELKLTESRLDSLLRQKQHSEESISSPQ